MVSPMRIDLEFTDSSEVTVRAFRERARELARARVPTDPGLKCYIAIVTPIIGRMIKTGDIQLTGLVPPVFYGTREPLDDEIGSFEQWRIFTRRLT